MKIVLLAGGFGIRLSEEIYLNNYKSMSELRYSIKNYIKKYNTKRLDSAIDNKTHDEVYFKYR